MSSSRAAATAGGTAANSVRSLATSTAAAGLAAAAAGGMAGSTRSSSDSGAQQSSGRGSSRSVSSSVAMAQLSQLEAVLLKERQAREEAERTLQFLHAEKMDKDAVTKRSERSEKQLQTLLTQLQRVVSNPNDPERIRTLQKYALQGTTSATPSERSVASSSSSKSNNAAVPAGSGAGPRGARSGGHAPLVVASPAPASAGGEDRYAASFFEKFGRGDYRQQRVIDKAQTKLHTSGATAGPARAAAGAPNGNNSLHAGHVAAVGSRGTMAQGIPAFTHRKTDLFATH